MATYNGHKNWNHWNVSLWINNDEGLYQLARDCRYRYCDCRVAAKVMLEALQDIGQEKTPDDAPYSVSSVYAAIVDIV